MKNMKRLNKVLLLSLISLPASQVFGMADDANRLLEPKATVEELQEVAEKVADQGQQLEALKDAVENRASDIKDVAEEVVEVVTQPEVQEVVEAVAQPVQEAVETVAQPVQDVVETVAKKVQDAPSKWSRALSWLQDKGTAISDFFVNQHPTASKRALIGAGVIAGGTLAYVGGKKLYNRYWKPAKKEGGPEDPAKESRLSKAWQGIKRGASTAVTPVTWTWGRAVNRPKTSIATIAGLGLGTAYAFSPRFRALVNDNGLRFGGLCRNSLWSRMQARPYSTTAVVGVPTAGLLTYTKGVPAAQARLKDRSDRLVKEELEAIAKIDELANAFIANIANAAKDEQVRIARCPIDAMRPVLKAYSNKEWARNITAMLDKVDIQLRTGSFSLATLYPAFMKYVAGAVALKGEQQIKALEDIAATASVMKDGMKTIKALLPQPEAQQEEPTVRGRSNSCDF